MNIKIARGNRDLPPNDNIQPLWWAWPQGRGWSPTESASRPPISNGVGPARLVSIGIAPGRGGGWLGSAFGAAVNAMAVQAAGTIVEAHRRHPRPHPDRPCAGPARSVGIGIALGRGGGRPGGNRRRCAAAIHAKAGLAGNKIRCFNCGRKVLVAAKTKTLESKEAT